MTTMYHYLKQALDAGFSHFRIDATENTVRKAIEFEIVPFDVRARKSFVVAKFSVDESGKFLNAGWQGYFQPLAQYLGKSQEEVPPPIDPDTQTTAPENSTWDQVPTGTPETTEDGVNSSECPTPDFSEPAPQTDSY